MNTLEQAKIFTRVAELASFTQAADSLGLPKASVSTAVQLLEATLGTRLLHRTTRRVQLTQDGQAFYERSKDLLADMDELQTMFQQQGSLTLRGRVRLNMSTGIARHAVIPHLPTLLAEHPLLELEFSSTERKVDLVREGFDCVLRTGAIVDTGLIARPLGQLRMVNCASPAYLRAHGTPHTLSDLADPAAGHCLVHFVNTLGSRPAGFEYLDGDRDCALPLPGAITVNNADAYTAACVAGLGIIQVPLVGLQSHIEEGRLVTLLPSHVARPMPITLLYANRRNLSKRVRVMMDWLAGVMTTYLAASSA
ncbi:MAG: LysR family transcriptional regulator [Rhodoferax sp.]|uniref:LysR family transcriptional regulator n=1 Tax=Rhodoferax sp. TaxID=50421 RepID=UPI002ACE20F8|nr:LysR family transcriptional regulator [Rhodoferax sp.]MDZ7892793.1 LysR family transcriptional regulator [Rhodoferax sp.]